MREIVKSKNIQNTSKIQHKKSMLQKYIIKNYKNIVQQNYKNTRTNTRLAIKINYVKFQYH